MTGIGYFKIRFVSKYAFVELIPTKSAPDVPTVFMKYSNIRGKPKIVLTDNGYF